MASSSVSSDRVCAIIAQTLPHLTDEPGWKMNWWPVRDYINGVRNGTLVEDDRSLILRTRGRVRMYDLTLQQVRIIANIYLEQTDRLRKH